MFGRQNAAKSDVCPKTGKPIRRKRFPAWALWLYPLLGFGSAIWFLLRVAPKPSRAAYPCQRLAAPLASSFVVWITGILVSALAFHKASDWLRRSRYVVAAIAIAVGVVGVYFVGVSTPQDDAKAVDYDDRYNVKPPNQPVGVPQGINPGRVVWVRDPDATDWNGSTGLWRDEGNTDAAVVDDMVSSAVRWLTSETNDADAWDALFRHRNQKLGKGDVGYDPTEKIAIKLNLVATGTLDGNGYQVQNLQYNGHSKEMIHSLIRQLVDEAGVPQENIYIGDPSNSFARQFRDYISTDFPNIHFMTLTAAAGCETVQFSTVQMKWSTPDAVGKTPDYFTQYYVNAEYFIDFAILKAHWAGITMVGKNHYGSMTRRPDATGDGYFAMHDSLAYVDPVSGHYRALVDLLGHETTGGKALLYMVDGLWGGYGWGGVTPPVKWHSAPFGNDWPSSVLMSQDPIAIDSVGFDLWYEEDKVSWNRDPFNRDGKEHFPHITGGCEYLVEGAQADNPPSGPAYDPEDDGIPMESLGVHEHRNAAGLYTGAQGDGIDLITSSSIPPVAVVARNVFYNNSVFDGNDLAANAADDDAIAPDKSVLQGNFATATFANYTSYDRGINGIMVDITNLAGTPTSTDVTCRVGDGETWSAGPAPSVSVRLGDGLGGSDRVTLTWPDRAIRNTWCEITIEATAATGLASADTFVVGNAPGDTCDSVTDAHVTAADVDNCADNPTGLNLDDFVILKQNFGVAVDAWGDGDYNRDGLVDLDDFVILKQCFGTQAALDNPRDHNRDGRVDDADMAVSSDNQTDASNCLPMPVPQIEVIFVDWGATWSYLDDGSDQGTAWRESVFAAGDSWATGPAPLGYGDSGMATTIGYGGNSSNKYITAYFRHTFNVDNASAFITLTAELVRDDAAVVYLNGSLLFPSNISGTITYLTVADSSVNSANEATVHTYNLLDAGLLVDGDNVMAIELHQRSITSSDTRMDLRLLQPAP